jgi:magnesium chelatase family protein
LPGILPDLTPRESLDVTRIYSAAGLMGENDGPIRRPPFRDPHHSASQPALVGGGARAKPGEISLAHRGVLFLDELPEFSRQALEALRQPLETGQATIARAAAHVTYPARFQLVAAMNPCRCGHLGDASRECRKAPRCGEDYLNRLSGPLLDRLDLWVGVQPLSPLDLMTAERGEDSATVAARVARARLFQDERGQTVRNAEASPEQFELLDDARLLLADAARKLRLSARGFTRLLRVARTIADLEGSFAIRTSHISEAVSFRHRQGVS